MMHLIIDSIKYPNLSIVIVDETAVDLFLRCLDSDASGHFWDQWSRVTFPEGAPSEQICERIFEALKGMVLHEVDENFKVDGVQLHPPHPPGWQRPGWAPQPTSRT